MNNQKNLTGNLTKDVGNCLKTAEKKQNRKGEKGIPSRF